MSFTDPPPVLSSPGALTITEVRIQPQNARALKAFASITFNDAFVVRGLKVIEGLDGRFVAMPARKRKDDTFQDVAHPVTKEFRAYMESVVLRAYMEAVGELQPSAAR
jgi:stage V sporulation protein G